MSLKVEVKGKELVALLLNPPAVSSGARTRNAVSRAAAVLGFEHVTISNLCAAPTRSVVELVSVGSDAWDQARLDLECALGRADAVLGGWGVATLTGDARYLLREQVTWLHDRTHVLGIDTIWMVGGEPRHPSRWHQYLSDKHGRTAGGSFDERLGQALLQVPLRLSFGSALLLGNLADPKKADIQSGA